MNTLAPYSIPIQGLKVGVHHFQFLIDRDFFALFEGSPIEEGTVKFEVDFDKRPDMLLIDFTFEGSVGAECDRCTAMIDLPLKDQRQLIVKYGKAEGEEEDEGRREAEGRRGQGQDLHAVRAHPLPQGHGGRADRGPRVAHRHHGHRGRDLRAALSRPAGRKAGGVSPAAGSRPLSAGGRSAGVLRAG